MIALAGALLTSLLALGSLIFRDMKSESGKLTKAGWFTVSMIVASAAINAYVAFQSERAADTLDMNVRRGLYPLGEIEVGYWADLPIDHPGLADFHSKLIVALHKFPADYQQRKLEESEDLEVSKKSGVRNGEMHITQLRLKAKSSLFPDRLSDPVAFHLLNQNQFRIEVFRRPRHLEEAIPLKCPYGRGADLGDTALVPGSPPVVRGASTSEATQVVYDIERDTFLIEAPGSRMRSNQRGRVRSILDLVGAQLLMDPFQACSSWNLPYADDARKNMRLTAVMLIISPGSYFWLFEDDWTEYRTEDGFPIYEYRFPATEDGLMKLLDLKS